MHKICASVLICPMDFFCFFLQRRLLIQYFPCAVDGLLQRTTKHIVIQCRHDRRRSLHAIPYPLKGGSDKRIPIKIRNRFPDQFADFLARRFDLDKLKCVDTDYLLYIEFKFFFSRGLVDVFDHPFLHCQIRQNVKKDSLPVSLDRVFF